MPRGKLINKNVIVLVIVWATAMGSLLGVHFFLRRNPYDKRFDEPLNIANALNDDLKKSISHLETGIIRLNDKKFYFIGTGFEDEEQKLIAENKISQRKIDFFIEDPILLERRIMASEAVRTLNNAEKNCLADKFATLMYKNGEYFFYFDPKKYEEYVIKYGKECKPCEEDKKRKTTQK